MKKITVCADSLVSNNQMRQKIQAVAHDLQLVKQAMPGLDHILVRGGSVVDILLGKEPNDIDLFYSWREHGRISSRCMCDEIKLALDSLPFTYFAGKAIDLENSYEKEPRLDPLERTIGFFSYHCDYISMFCIDESGKIWSRQEAISSILSRTYEIRFEGALPWSYFSGSARKDAYNYYEFLLYQIIRATGYIAKRDLSPGPRVSELVANTEYIFQQAIAAKGIETYRPYASSKMKIPNNVKIALGRFDIGENARQKAEHCLLKLLA